jgi:hypothetical protein
LTKSSFTGAFNASSTVAINHAEHWRPKEMNPQNPFLLSSKRSSDASVFAEKENRLASTEKQRSNPSFSKILIPENRGKTPMLLKPLC